MLLLLVSRSVPPCFHTWILLLPRAVAQCMEERKKESFEKRRGALTALKIQVEELLGGEGFGMISRNLLDSSMQAIFYLVP